MNCQSCDAIYINGVLCHESGCPDAWRDEVRECVECGCEFTPEDKDQSCCSDDCYHVFIGGGWDDRKDLEYFNDFGNEEI